MEHSEFAKSIQHGWRRWRTPLPHGGRRGWRITLAVGLSFIVAALFSPMGSNVQARIAMTGFGAMSAVLVLARPRSFWERLALVLWGSRCGHHLSGDSGILHRACVVRCAVNAT